MERIFHTRKRNLHFEIKVANFFVHHLQLRFFLSNIQRHISLSQMQINSVFPVLPQLIYINLITDTNMKMKMKITYIQSKRIFCNFLLRNCSKTFSSFNKNKIN